LVRLRRFLLLALLGAVFVPWGAAQSRFHEVWAYLDIAQDGAPRPGLPVTDWAFFGATLNSQGELTGLPPLRAVLRVAGRRHLVLANVDNAALAHLSLSPLFPVRASLLDALAEAARPYDGLQLDFEAVADPDKEAFWSFLTDLRGRIAPRALSVALPARTRATTDAFDYTAVAPRVDRIIVMAYDEHWSGGSPGAVASLDWGRRVAAYAQTRIAPVQLVMGAPFYGRAWAEKRLARAYRYPTLAQLMVEKGVGAVERTEGVPHFEYEETVRVRVWFEDRASMEARLQLYAAARVNHVAFWRLGQEDPGVWDLVAPWDPVASEGPAPRPGPRVPL